MVPVAVLAILLVFLVVVAIAGAGSGVGPGLGSQLALGIRDSVYLVAMAAVIALPIGAGAAIYLEEYGGRGWLGKLVELNIANLTAVPSVVYGLLALELFARSSSVGGGLFAGALSLALVVSPMLIIASREALRSVSLNQREAAVALGASRSQVIRAVVLPIAAPGILSAAIVAVARALGEAAPLLVLGGIVFGDALPVRIFEVIELSIEGALGQGGAGQALESEAAAAMLVLLALVLGFNGLAMIVRDRWTRRIYGLSGADQ